ncbi:MAG: restriction endonuclease subunit S [Saprospiraceae bacterium]
MEIPENWVVLKLGEIAEINPRKRTDEISDETLVSFIPMKAVEETTGKFDATDIRHLKDVKKGYTSFFEGDMIFAKITPCMENGKIAVAHNLKNGLGFGSTEFHVVRFQADILKQYAFYYVIQKRFRDKARLSMTGSAGQLRVPKSFLEEVEIPLPPLPEQHRIVAKLEELFSELDNGIANLKKAQAQLKVYRQAVLKAAFEGKLTEQWRAASSEATPDAADKLLEQIKVERQRHSKKPKEYPPLTEAELKELPALPVGWKWVVPELIADPSKHSLTIGPFGSDLKVSDYEKSGVPLIFVRHITSNNFDLNPQFISEIKFQELIAHAVEPDDLLITKMGDPPGDCTIYPKGRPTGIITADCLKFRVWGKYFSKMFYYHCINSTHVKKQLGLITKGVAQKKISLARFKSILLPLPSPAEQHQIVQEIESRLSVCDHLEQEIGKALQQSEALRQSILKKAFEGRLI